MKDLDTPEKEPTTKVIAATKPSLISIVVATQTVMRKPRIAGQPTAMPCASSPQGDMGGSKIFKATSQRRKTMPT
jgi:hypothetical protein